MTLATTIVAAHSVHLAGWVQMVLLVAAVIGMGLVLESHDRMPNPVTAKRIAFGVLLAIVLVTVGSGVLRAVTIIDCGEHITWLDWIFWIC